MAVCKILPYPDPFLRRVAKEVMAFDGLLAQTVQDLLDTMYSMDHCVGVAATQVGMDQRIFVMDTSRREKSSQGLAILINPVLEEHHGNIYTKEGCLSLPTFLGRVGRSEKAWLRAQDAQGREQHWDFSGLDAICAQHELDHLNGMLFVDRLASLRGDLYLRGKK